MRECHTSLTNGATTGQQRVPGAQLGLDIAARERSQSRRWVKGHAQLAGVNSSFFFFLLPSYCRHWAHSPQWAHLKLLDTTVLVSQSPGMLNSLLWKTRRRFTFSGSDSVDNIIVFYLTTLVTLFTDWTVQTCLVRFTIQYNDNATVALFLPLYGFDRVNSRRGKTHKRYEAVHVSADVTWQEAKRNKEKPCVKLRLFRHALWE